MRQYSLQLPNDQEVATSSIECIDWVNAWTVECSSHLKFECCRIVSIALLDDPNHSALDSHCGLESWIQVQKIAEKVC